MTEELPKNCMRYGGLIRFATVTKFPEVFRIYFQMIQRCIFESFVTVLNHFITPPPQHAKDNLVQGVVTFFKIYCEI